MKDIIERIIADYPAYRDGGRAVKDKSPYDEVCVQLPSTLSRLISDSEQYLCQGSCGAGNVTRSPWVAAFNKQVTSSAEDGYYPVYLFSVDFQRLYLSIALGTTQFQRFHKTKTADQLEAIRQAAVKMQAFLPETVQSPSQFVLSELELATESKQRLQRSYEASNIVAIQYNPQQLPGTAQLEADFRSIVSIYEKLIKNPLLPSVAALAGATSPPIEEVNSVQADEFIPRSRPKKKINQADEAVTEIEILSRKVQSRRTKEIGDRGEKLVYDYERKRLKECGRPDLADRVTWLASENEVPGYDILSFEPDGTEKYIEVKSSVSNLGTATISENEWKAAQLLKGQYYLYIVTKVESTSPKIEEMKDLHSFVESGAVEIYNLAYTLDFRTR